MRRFGRQRLAIVSGLAVLGLLVALAASQYLALTEFQPPDGEDTAPPYVRANPSVLPFNGRAATTTIKWNVGDNTVGQLWVVIDDRDMKMLVQGKRGTLDAPWIMPHRMYELRLYEGTDRQQVLASTRMHQENGGSTEAARRGTIVVAVVLVGLGVLACVDLRSRRSRPTGPADPPAASETADGPPLPTMQTASERSATARPAKIDALTALRFPAAAIIVFLHFRELPGFSPVWGWPFPFTIGVTFFFVLSGFILTYVYPALSPAEIPRFWWARFARIWPAHLVAMAFAVALLPLDYVNQSARIWPILAHLGLIHAWIPNPNSYYAFNQPSWSISDEFAFYLSFPLLLVLLARSRALLLLASAAVLGGTIVACNVFLEGPTTWPSVLSPFYFTYQNPLARQFEFVLGMLACHVWRRLHDHPRLTVTVCTVLEIGTLAAAGTLAYAVGSRNAASASVIGDALSSWVLNSSAAIPFAALIAVVTLRRGLVARLLTFGPLVLLGEISYSVYLLHYTVARAIITWDADGYVSAAISPWVMYVGAWTATLTLAYLVWRFVETPARRFLVRMTQRPAAPRGAATPEAVHVGA